MDVSPLLVVVLDPHGRIVLFNNACQRATGYAASDIEGDFLWDRLLLEQEADGVRAMFARLTAGQFPNEHENYWVARDGQRRWIRWANTALTNADGAVEYVIGTGVDLTERRNVEEALHEAHQRNHAILDTAVDAIITIDPRGLIESFNRSAQRIFGYGAEEVIGKSVNMLMPTPYREQHDGYIQHYLDTGQKKIIGIGREVVGLRKNGELFPMELAVAEVRFGDTRLFTGMVRDITDRRRAEQEARRRLNELAHVSRMSSISEMASGLAHEINQPLAAIVSYAEASLRLIKSGSPDLAMITTALEAISEQGTRAGDIVGHLRQFVRKGQVERRPTDVNTLVREVLALVKYELNSKQIQVRAEFGADLPPIDVDKIQIQQVLLNLVRNAIEAMEATPASQRLLAVHTRLQDMKTAEISVRDSGHGIQESAERLFEQFYTTKQNGMGLGLSISRSILKAHGGNLWAESLQDAGACFRFSLPVHGRSAS